jgi:hypothetical protein
MMTAQSTRGLQGIFHRAAGGLQQIAANRRSADCSIDTEKVRCDYKPRHTGKHAGRRALDRQS